MGAEDLTFAAFKVLPIDPARIRGSSSSTSGMFAEASDELAGASSCREAVDLIVDSIQRACEDIGSAHVGFVTKEDVVGYVYFVTANVHFNLMCEYVDWQKRNG